MSAAPAQPLPNTVKPEEVNRFSALADKWWDANGPMKPLHQLNPTRLAFLVAEITKHFGANNQPTLLDIGCGAGLVSEAMAKKNYTVTGIDASADLIQAAILHAKQEKVTVTYQQGEITQFAKGKNKFDVVLALEVVEHVANPEIFIKAAADCLKPNGLLILSTLNRTPKSFALGIVGAEYILRWLPIGTHDWHAFIKPSELSEMVAAAGLSTTTLCGLRYHPFSGSFSMDSRDVDVNYFLIAKK